MNLVQRHRLRRKRSQQRRPRGFLPIGKRSLAGAALTCLLLLASTGCDTQVPGPGRPEPRFVIPFPPEGAYTGAYMDFGKTEDHVTLDAIEDFEEMVGKRQAIIAFSSFWGEESFPETNIRIVSRHDSIPLIFWSPWDRPYAEERGPDRFSLPSIVDGVWDTYIERWVDSARDTGQLLLVSWGLEMNGSWFPWSGIYYPNEKPTGTAGASGEKPAGPGLFKKAFRHIVDIARSRGGTNLLWGFHCNNFSYPEEEWNTCTAYYPGSEYVDWLGLSVYGKQYASDPWVSFHEAMDRAYHEICGLDPSKPVIVAEWGVGEFPRDESKAVWIQDALEAFRTQYRRVRGAVYWHERWKNPDESHSNLRVNSSPEALDAYRRGVSDPYWLGRVQRAGKAWASP